MLMEPINLTFKIHLREGEQLTLPPSLLDSIGPGEWTITVRPAHMQFDKSQRDHLAFLNGYVTEDDLLYADLADDHTGR